MPFGVADAPTALTNIINRIFKPYLDQLTVVFIDDKASKNLSDPITRIRPTRKTGYGQKNCVQI